MIFDELKRINFENKLRKEDVIIRSQLTEKIKSNKFNCGNFRRNKILCLRFIFERGKTEY